MAAVRGGPAGPRGCRGPQEGEEPEPHVAEEGKKVIKALVARQSDTSLSLQQQRAREQERDFTRCSVVHVGPSVQGTTTLVEFQDSARRLSGREELVARGLRRGLDDDELRLLLDDEAGVEVRLSGPERAARQHKLREIREKLAIAEDDNSSHPRQAPSSASRHVEELLTSLRPDGAHSQLVQLALRGTEPVTSAEDVVANAAPFREPAAPPPAHPVHRLPDLERRLFGHLDESVPPSATSRKRRRLRRSGQDDDDDSEVQLPLEPVASTSVPGASLWDVRVPTSAPSEKKVVERKDVVVKTYGPERRRQFTVVDGKIVPLDDRPRSTTPPPPTAARPKGQTFVVTDCEGTRIDQIRSNRLSIEEIRQIPRFANYEPGSPSQVLYLKNLADSVTEDDLATLLVSFRTPGANLTFRLMSGRLRGQAFINFPSMDAANQALQEINGFVLKGRPLIAQFGREK